MVRFLLRWLTFIPLVLIVAGIVVLVGKRGRVCRGCTRWVPKNEHCPCGHKEDS